MVRTHSTMLPLGTSLPSFELSVVKGNHLIRDKHLRGLDQISNTTLAPKPILIMVLCAHCPFVKHIEPELTKLDQKYGGIVQMLAISSNSLITHPQDGPNNLAIQSLKQGWTFPYLLDLDQSLAKSLKAACTPDFFLFAANQDGDQILRYRGQLDSSRPGNNIPLDGQDLRRALDDVLERMTAAATRTQQLLQAETPDAKSWYREFREKM